MNKINSLIYIVSICACIGCSNANDIKDEINKENNDLGDWELKQKVTKQIDSLVFIFPGEGYAFERRDSLAKECMKAIAQNLKLTGIKEFTAPYKIEFFQSKAAMKEAKGMGVSGYNDYWKREVNFVSTNDLETVKKENIIPTPIVHEFLHMVAMETWGVPPNNNNWLNEGLATYAANSCNGLCVAEIYSFLFTEDMIFPMDSLVNNFYGQDEMIAYHQSAYIVQSLIEFQGIEKIKELWQAGFADFEKIYGIPYSEMESKINSSIIDKYPTSIVIDWETFKKGCK